MPISVSCECGARLKVRDEAAGKRLKCPKCAASLAVPSPAPAEDDGLKIVQDDAPSEAPAVKGTKTCPDCGEEIQKAAIVCRFCKRTFGSRGRSLNRTKRPSDLVEERGTTGFPVEIFVAIAVIAFDLVMVILNARKVEPAMTAGGLVMDSVMILGLSMRSMWGWWLSFVIFMLRIGIFGMVLLSPGRVPQKEMLTALAVGYVVGLACLVISRFRDAYRKSAI